MESTWVKAKLEKSSIFYDPNYGLFFEAILNIPATGAKLHFGPYLLSYTSNNLVEGTEFGCKMLIEYLDTVGTKTLDEASDGREVEVCICTKNNGKSILTALRCGEKVFDPVHISLKTNAPFGVLHKHNKQDAKDSSVNENAPLSNRIAFWLLAILLFGALALSIYKGYF